jgi:type IV pilus assembly protein PilV
MNNIHQKSISQDGFSFSQGGFTLLEVMIAMVIFAVGMLGLAGIQALSLESSHSSYSRSQAVLLASDMVDRMKANPSALASYVIDTATTPSAPSPLCNAAECNNTEMAAFDLWQWKTALPVTLLSGKGSITVAGSIYTITVHWDEDRTGATGTTCPPAIATDLRCFQLTTM